MTVKDRLRFQKAFSRLDGPLKTQLASVKSVLDLALVSLALAHDKANIEELNVQEMSDSLEYAGVSLTPLQLAKALAKAGGNVKRRKVEGKVQFTLMTKGRLRIEPLLGVGNLDVFFIDGSKPRTARKRLSDVLAGVSGTVRVCDPWYGVRSLESLEMIPKDCKVRFLSGRTNEDPQRLAGPMKDFKAERPKTELRTVPNAAGLHDRYVLTRDFLLLVGHGFKDLGSRQSFIITIPDFVAPDLLHQVETSFEAKWASAVPI